MYFTCFLPIGYQKFKFYKKKIVLHDFKSWQLFLSFFFFVFFDIGKCWSDVECQEAITIAQIFSFLPPCWKNLLSQFSMHTLFTAVENLKKIFFQIYNLLSCSSFSFNQPVKSVPWNRKQQSFSPPS